MIKLTKTEALAIQAKQVAHYAAIYPELDVAGIVAKATTADELPEGKLDVVEINKHIPRGGFLEMLIGKFQQTHD